jgi:hypothetical protein
VPRIQAPRIWIPFGSSGGGEASAAGSAEGAEVPDFQVPDAGVRDSHVPESGAGAGTIFPVRISRIIRASTASLL